MLATGGCTKHAQPAGAPDQSAPPPRQWPVGRTEPLKITDSLILEIPLQYVRSAVTGDKAPRALISVQSDRSEAHFDFFLPDYSGYTIQNYRNDSDENKVEVVYLHAGDPHEADPGAAGEYPPNMLKRSLKDFLNPNDYQDRYGLRCYRGRTLHDRITCYGRRESQRREDILLSARVPPYGPEVTFPTLQARYFSKRYGGVRIAWRTHVKNLPRWREIDAQIWKFIEAWNVAQAPQPPAPTRPAPASPGGIAR